MGSYISEISVNPPLILVATEFHVVVLHGVQGTELI